MEKKKDKELQKEVDNHDVEIDETISVLDFETNTSDDDSDKLYHKFKNKKDE